MSPYRVFEPCRDAHAAWRAAPLAGFPLGRRSRREDQHRAAHLVGTDEARRQPAIPGGSGRAHATAMLAERQRQVLQAKIAEVRDPRPALCRRSSADTLLDAVFPQEESVRLDVSAPM
jgi:hypothetical protein